MSGIIGFLVLALAIAFGIYLARKLGWLGG